MEEAASLASTTNNKKGKAGKGKGTLTKSETSVASVESAVKELEEKEKSVKVVKVKQPVDKPKPKDRPWKASPNSPKSVSTASKFLAETQKQHEIDHPQPSPSDLDDFDNISLPSLSNASHMNLRNKLGSANARQFLWDDQSLSSAYTQKTSRSSAMVNLHDVKGSFRSTMSGSGGSKSGAHAKLDQQNGKAQKKHVGPRGARWHAINSRGKELVGEGLWNKLPLFGAGGQQAGGDYTSVAAAAGNDGGAGTGNGDSHSVASGTSSKYRDQEGERLLDMASKRLSSLQHAADDDDDDNNIGKTQKRSNKTSHNGEGRMIENLADLREEATDAEYGELEDADDDSFMQESERRRVFLDRDGNLSYDKARFSFLGNNGVEDYEMTEEEMHSRRMWNSYKRALKKPMLVLCGILMGAAILAVAGTLYSKMLLGMGRGDGDNSSGSEQVESYNDWVDTLEEVNTSPVAEKKNENVEPKEDGEGFPTKSKGESNEDELLPLDKPRFDHIRYTLINQGASPPEVFLDTHSAQYAAVVWLTRDDPRRMDPDSVYLRQRYGLAVLWFSTIKSGYEWHVASPEEGGMELYADEYDGDGDDGNDDEMLPRRNLKENDPNLWFRHDSWLTSAGICGWHGVQCHPHENGNAHDPNNDGDVSRVELRRNNLNGLIPDEIYTTLPYLTVLDLSDNGFAGTLSENVGNWEHIEVLNLTSNNIAGSLTPSIGKLTTLKALHLANNLLEESIPHSVGTMKSLRHLDLSGNSIRGTIPYEMGDMTEMSSLNLSWNLLVGPIPHEFSEMQTLVSLDVSHNDLGGPLLTELSYITYLTILRLNDNNFSGEVPREIGNLGHLDELHLNNNDFRGTLPGEISKLDGLDSLNVAKNHFEGGFPPEWTEMAGLQALDVSSNQLNGEIPIFIDGMKNLRSLNMAHNDFASSIPSELGSLYKLEYLYLDDNELVSSVPWELGELTNLKKLALHNNYLSGDVDNRICKLSDELFLTQLSVDCGGEMPTIYCDCCICHDHEPIVHLNKEP